VPVPKTKPVHSIESDLQPISLLPTLANVFESIVGTWLANRLAPTLDSNQFGSLKGRSTTHYGKLHLTEVTLSQPCSSIFLRHSTE